MTLLKTKTYPDVEVRKAMEEWMMEHERMQKDAVSFGRNRLPKTTSYPKPRYNKPKKK